MAQLIITTDVSSIRPVFTEGAAENIKRYNQLKKLFENTLEYRIFAEPVLAGQDKIAWHTNFDGKIIPFRKLEDDENEAERAKSLLKTQVNKLYKKIIELIEDEKDRLRLFKLLDSCFEIPDYDDIFIVQNASGEKNFCIVRWGFIDEGFDADEGLIAKLIPLKVADVTVKVIKGNNKYVPNEKIFVNKNGKEYEFVSDQNAEILLNDVDLLSEITLYQKDDEDNPIYEQKYFITTDTKVTFFIGNQEFSKQNISIQTLDEDDNILPNATIRIQYDDVDITADSDSDGKINIGELYVDTEIYCTQISKNREIKKAKFNVEQGKEIYFLRLVKQATSGTVKVVVKNENNKPIANADYQVKYDDGTIKYYKSDENGVLKIENAPFKEPVVFRQIVDKLPQFQQILKFTDGNSVYEIKGIDIKQPSDFSSIKIKVVNVNNEPISNLRVRLENGIKSNHRITDKDGQVLFENVDCTKDITVFVEHKNHKKTQKIECSDKQTEVIIKLGKKIGLWWLWILLAILAIFLLVFFLPKINFNKNPHITTDSIVNNTTTNDTVPVVVTKGMNLKIVDENNNPVKNADVIIGYNDSTFKKTSNEKGIVIFETIEDTSKFVTALVKVDGMGEQRFTFKVKPNKTLMISEESVDISEEILNCGTNVKSMGYHSTVKIFNMHTNKGTFLLRYNMNTIPDRIIVYKGNNNSANKIIWQAPKPEQNIHSVKIPFNSPDSLITVEIKGGDTTFTQWDFTVNCPK